MLSKRNGAKFRHFSLSFRDWLIGGTSCLTALGREFSNRGYFFSTILFMLFNVLQCNLIK